MEKSSKLVFHMKQKMKINPEVFRQITDTASEVDLPAQISSLCFQYSLVMNNKIYLFSSCIL